MLDKLIHFHATGTYRLYIAQKHTMAKPMRMGDDLSVLVASARLGPNPQEVIEVVSDRLVAHQHRLVLQTLLKIDALTDWLTSS